MEEEIWHGWKFTSLGEKPDGGHALKNYLYRRKRHNLQWGVIKILQKMAPALVQGKPDPLLDNQIIQEILEAIEHQQPGYALKHCRNFFVQGLDKGVREGLWDIAVPAPIITVRRKKALFQPEVFTTALPQIRKIQQILTQTWSDPDFFQQADAYIEKLKRLRFYKPGNEMQQLRAGQLLLSALLYGGLLDSKYLYLLPRHITELQANQDCCWIDFIEETSTIWEKDSHRRQQDKGKQLRQENVLRRRWFPDSVTELLLLRWQHQQLGEFPVPEGMNPDKADTYCQYLINAFLGSVGFTTKIIPTRILIDGAIITSGLEIPAFLVNFASGKTQTTSLPSQAWQRLYSNCRVGQSKQELILEQTELTLQLSEHLNDNASNIKRYDQHRLYKKLSKQLTDKREDKRKTHAQSIKIIEAFMDEHRGKMALPLYYLCQWAIEMYRNGSYTKARLAVSTVPKYLGQLQELVNVVGSEDLLTLDAEELLEIYQDMVNRSKTLKAKAYKAGRIKEFHHFLLKCGYPGHLDLNELEGVKAHGSAVDANYLNETAYQASLNELNRVDARHLRIVTIRRLITMLGYRCGLRRTEAWKLRLCDIQISHYPVLLIRASQYKTVKSPQSIRQLPLKSLLTQQELDEFLHWVEQRRLEQGLGDFATDSSFLFCHEHNGLSLIKEDLIFPVIQMVLRAVTGDDSLRYHHLRHSCANNVLLHLQKITWHELALEKIEPAESETNNLFGLSDQYPSRKHLFQVSALLGHASPDITLKNYIHCCDYLLRHYLNQAHDNTLPVASVAVMSGISRESLYKSRQRKYPALSVLQIAKHQLREKTRLVKDENSAKQNEPVDWPEERLQLPQLYLLEDPPISILYQIIKNYDSEQKDARYWAEKTSYSEYQIQQWLGAALFLARMKTGKGTSRHIRPQWWGLADAEQKNAILIQETRQPPCCMPKPHNQQDVKDAQLALQHLKIIRHSRPELARWGIQYYLENNVASHSHLRMKTLDDAKRFKEFLLALGFAKKRIHCQLKPQTRPGSLPEHKQVKFWAKELSIQTKQITARTPIEKRGSDLGSLSMLVVHENGHASYGIRYAFYMTGILMLVADELNLSC